ncbi:MAG: SMP-30/gluconolactonase/LRE family protein [Balneolaceae bacterium]
MSNQDGAADGMAIDLYGRLYSTGPSGLSIFDSEGTHVRDISFPQRISNLKWGGENHNELLITSVERAYRLEFNVMGSKPR